jgi:acid phosphatase type 7
MTGVARPGPSQRVQARFRPAQLPNRRIAWMVALWLLGAGALAVAAVVVARRQAAPPATPVGNQAFVAPAQPDAPAELWAVGDVSTTSASRAVAARIGRARPDRVLYLGDVYERGTAAELRDFADVFGSLVNRMAPTPGNHDWPNHRTGYDPYWRSVTGAPTPPWYAFRIGGWRVVSLNSETPYNAAQLRWLRTQLRAAPGNCTLAFWHRPRFSAGMHGDQTDVELLWRAVRGRARLVLSGHDHDMQRLRPISGTTLLVSGAGGRSRYGVDESDRRLAFSDERHNGALRLRLRPGHAAMAFVAADGSVLDRSSARCSVR